MISSRSGANLVKGACAIVAAVLCSASPAGADSATMSVTDTAGRPDPAADVSRIYTISGTSSTPKELFVKFRAPGGAACAPSAAQDTGTHEPFWYGTRVNGAFTLQLAYTWRSPGSFAFCYWLADSDRAIATPISQIITFRPPSGTITATMSPVAPITDQDVAFTVTGSTETPGYVYAKVRSSGGAGCAPTADTDTGEYLINESAVNGAFALPATSRFSSPGGYLLCLWLARDSDDPSPIAGPQPQPFVVEAPAVVQPLRIGGSATIRRRGSRPARYSGRVATLRECRRNRLVVLRRVGSGSRSFGTARTRLDGTYTIRRPRRLRGTVFALVTHRRQGPTTCMSIRSYRIRG